MTEQPDRSTLQQALTSARVQARRTTEAFERGEATADDVTAARAELAAAARAWRGDADPPAVPLWLTAPVRDSRIGDDLGSSSRSMLDASAALALPSSVQHRLRLRRRPGAPDVVTIEIAVADLVRLLEAR